MNRATSDDKDRGAGQSVTAGSAIRWEATAAELAAEFGAPVAIFDPRLRCYRALVGAAETQFPEIDEPLIRVCRSDELAQGHVFPWQRPSDPARTWLFLPVSGGLVALAGFIAPDLNKAKPRFRRTPDICGFSASALR